MSAIIGTTCIDELIKISRTQCECDELPFDADEGLTDIYLDEVEGLNLRMIESAADCEQGGLWDMLYKARTNAAQKLIADLTNSIQKVYDVEPKPWYGVVGEPKWNADLSVKAGFAGIKISPRPAKSAAVIIKRIGLAVNVTGNYNVSVYSRADINTPIATYTIPATAGAMSWYDLPSQLSLPAYNDQIDYVEYFIGYQYAGGFNPKNTKFHCGCGGVKVYYDLNRPMYKVPSKQNLRWMGQAMIAGFNGASLNTVFNSCASSSFNYGVFIDASFVCYQNDFICREIESEGNNNTLQLAYAMRYKAASLLIDTILSSGNVNRYTMLDREALYGKREHYNRMYWMIIDGDKDSKDPGLINIMNPLESGCYICRSTMRVRGIKA